MNNIELSDRFDLLYNNITSNQAPGLDEYEKSVFLTKAQREIVNSYFDPIKNKVMEGMDANLKRLFDFANLITTTEYINSEKSILFGRAYFDTRDYDSTQGYSYLDKGNKSFIYAKLILQQNILDRDSQEGTDEPSDPIEVPLEPVDMDILYILNEYLVVEDSSINRDIDTKIRLQIVPISYLDYTRLLLKPYARPKKKQAWKIYVENTLNFESGLVSKKLKIADFIVAPYQWIYKYVIRYVRIPKPIVLTNLHQISQNLSIDGVYLSTECELDSNIHEEILLRAVELAKAAFENSLNNIAETVAISNTDIGIAGNGGNK